MIDIGFQPNPYHQAILKLNSLERRVAVLEGQDLQLQDIAELLGDVLADLDRTYDKTGDLRVLKAKKDLEKLARLIYEYTN